MTTTEQAIAQANRNGSCKIRHRVFLMKTAEAAKHHKVPDESKPFVLIHDLETWAEVFPISGERDKRLLEVCEGRK